MTHSTPSSLPLLTEEIAVTTILDFFRDKPFVVFGTGMSCALDPRFGMPALKDELTQSISSSPQVSEEQLQWKKIVESLQSGAGLETALGNVSDLTLLQKITCATGRFVSSIDRKYALEIAQGKSTWPASGFFKRLVDTLPEGDPILHVLTPNYDTLFEHACDAVDIHYTSGFFGALERRMNWGAICQSLLLPERVRQGNRLRTTYKLRKHVRLYKVHGSLNYFFHRNSVVENNAWMWDAPAFSTRIMITPGISKHQKLQEYRQELLNSADTEIDNASRFLFLGYGFNDTHLETYITKKLIAQACKGLIVTKDSNSRIEALLDQAENLWLVCKLQESDGTRIFNKQFAGPLVLPAKRLWEIGTFTVDILGG